MSYVRYLLQSLNRDNGGFRFEALATDLLHATYAGNIVPSTGPVGPGDRGEDARTHPTYLLDSRDTFRIYQSPPEAAERIIFAYSIDADWKDKLMSDVEKILANDLGAERVVFVTNQFIPTRVRQDVEREALKQWGLPVEVLDAEWVASHLESQHYALAVRHLGADRPSDPNIEALIERVLDLKVGGMSAEDAAHVERLESDVRYRSDYEGRKHHLVLDLKALADVLSGYHEHLEAAIRMYEEALREGAAVPDKIIVADVYYDYFRALYRTQAGRRLILERLPEFISLIQEHDIVDYFEKVQTWLFFLIPPAVDAEIDAGRHRELMEQFSEFLDRYDTAGRSDYVQARIKEIRLILELWFAGQRGEDVISVFRSLSTLLDSTKDIDMFPVGRICELLARLSPIYGESPEYEGLYDKAESITAERESRYRAAELRRDRAMAHFERGEWEKAVYHLNIVKALWLGDETLRGSLLSGLMLARCYRELRLYHAARYEVAQCAYGGTLLSDQRHLDLVSAAYAELHWAALACGYILSAVEAGLWHLKAVYLWGREEKGETEAFSDYFEGNLWVILPRLLVANRPLHDEVIRRLQAHSWAELDFYEQTFLTTDEEFEATFAGQPEYETLKSMREPALSGQLLSLEEEMVDELTTTSIEFTCSGITFTIQYEDDYNLAVVAEAIAAIMPFLLLSRPAIKSELAWVEDKVVISVTHLEDHNGHNVEHVPENFWLSVRLGISPKAALSFRKPPFSDLFAVCMDLFVTVIDRCTITPREEIVEWLKSLADEGVFRRWTKQAPYGWTVHEFLPAPIKYEEQHAQEKQRQKEADQKAAARDRRRGKRKAKS